jgi:hypothetical protein
MQATRGGGSIECSVNINLMGVLTFHPHPWFVPKNSLEKVKALPTLIEYESFSCFWG